MATQGKQLKLDEARRLAGRICEELSPFCSQLEIGGSIRRGRPIVNDIDIVCLPVDVNGLKLRCGTRCNLVQDGEQNLIYRMPNGVQLDLWLAQAGRADLFDPAPPNWGSLLLNRTGSTAHNIFLIERAKELGLKWNPYYGVCVASATEEEVFRALQLDFIAPEKREK